ncbi:hypothetical protein [Faecalibacterium sp. An77]|uniref:hypothetical protein n=1 Tax=Faecalibacterium sp. An77 TaxID=1965655 RepID=UPI0011848C98|nr:hypothetical protein [Faecalibacterium sp. An77]
MPVVDENDKISYVPPEEDVLKKKTNDLIAQFEKYAQVHGLLPEEICIQNILLPRILLRVDKREGYFMIFHEQTRINEIKQAALMAYWILKLRPFMIKTPDPERLYKFSRINEGFAAFYLLSAFKKYSQINGAKEKGLSSRLVEELMYAFTYWDLSKESIILISESIAESFFGIEAQGIQNVD